MGKKPLVGLIGLVTAGMLVTAGCGECCRKNCRGDGMKEGVPAGMPKNMKMDAPAPGDKAPEKDLSPPAPPKPPDPTPVPGSDAKLGPQASLAPTGAAPIGQESLSPQQAHSPSTQMQGFDTAAQVANAAPSPSRKMDMPALPHVPRQTEVPSSARELTPTANRAPAAPNMSGETLPDIGSNAPPSRTALPSSSGMTEVPAPPPSKASLPSGYDPNPPPPPNR